jgi:hypothetical protein
MSEKKEYWPYLNISGCIDNKDKYRLVSAIEGYDLKIAINAHIQVAQKIGLDLN